MQLEIPALEGAQLRRFPFGGGVGVIGQVADYTSHLHEVERGHVRRAGPKRRLEYATGRHFARLGLLEIGQSSVAIPTTPHRSPLWPSGVVGSITHSNTLALSVVLHRARPFSAVGVDLEFAGRIDTELASRILTLSERIRPGAEDPTLIFSAKEAVFKAVHPLVGLPIDFCDVEIITDLARGGFKALYVGSKAANRIVDTGLGQCQAYEEHWVCIFAIPEPIAH